MDITSFRVAPAGPAVITAPTVMSLGLVVSLGIDATSHLDDKGSTRGKLHYATLRPHRSLRARATYADKKDTISRHTRVTARGRRAGDPLRPALLTIAKEVDKQPAA